MKTTHHINKCRDDVSMMNVVGNGQGVIFGKNLSISGILFRCTIRAGHATLAVALTSITGETTSPATDSEEVILVVVRFGGSHWNEGVEKNNYDISTVEDDFGRGAKMNTTAADGMSRCNNLASAKDHDKNCNKEKEVLTEMRSNIRRMCKLGNELEFRGHFDEGHTASVHREADEKVENAQPRMDYQSTESLKRFIVDYYIPSSKNTEHQRVTLAQQQELLVNMKVKHIQKWDSQQCQTVRAKYFPPPPSKQQKKRRNGKHDSEDASNSLDQKHTQQDCKKQPKYENQQLSQDQKRAHGGGVGKRKQGEILADFLIWILSGMENEQKIVRPSKAANNETSAQISEITSKSSENNETQRLWMERLVAFDPSCILPSDKSVTRRSIQSIGEIIDAAGGAGHVSLALALRGVHSTVVDPRPNIGKLPGRDRKVLKKALSKIEKRSTDKTSAQVDSLSRAVPFSTYRAWFGTRPTGVDSVFREGFSDSADAEKNDPTKLPICSMCSDDKLLPNCTAIIALHPDEATGSIVETAVKHKIPFVVVPCCVFSRLFPGRIKPRSNEKDIGSTFVSTYHDLIDWLVDKHPSIRVTRLPFEGANLAVWSTFQ